jgi:hypothetical protein
MTGQGGHVGPGVPAIVGVGLGAIQIIVIKITFRSVLSFNGLIVFLI